MSEIAIEAEGLSKLYRVKSPRIRPNTLRDAIAESSRSAIRRISNRHLAAEVAEDEFWALKDVSFQVNCGEAVGVIGRNGAGKSTLLKVLSRITEPTAGRVTIRGRVASLLEVGTGFHPELTGRENINLNGAILGMSRAEIKRKFEDIVEFAGVARFLDIPVKRYSSGMYMRLAFSVAAHLEPEILIVDEVLAVGDADFQKKCLGKLKDVTGEGRTVLFVSHNTSALSQLCKSGLLLEAGTVVGSGEISKIIDTYQKTLAPLSDQSTKLSGGLGIGIVSITHGGGPEELLMELSLDVDVEQTVSDLAILIHSASGIRVAVADLRKSLKLPRSFATGRYKILCHLRPALFVEQPYDIGIYLGSDGYRGNVIPLAQYIPLPRNEGSVPYPALHRGFIDLRVDAELGAR